MGDWMDPYFINALLEHWHHSVWTLSDPASPPMYFPAPGTLGYSHGLVLYAPFYLAFRLVAHPFQAYNLTLFAVMLSGSVCLYPCLRRLFDLSFLEAFLLTAFFVSSPNIVHGPLGVWSQRASVFLIPPIVLLVLVSRRLKHRPAGWLMAAVSGFLATALFTQDFYTAQFALLFLLFPAATMLVRSRAAIARTLKGLWRERRPWEALAASVLLAAVAWTLVVTVSGGAGVSIAGLRVSSHDARRPAAIALVSAVLLMWRRGPRRVEADIRALGPWRSCFAVGAAAGVVMFGWIYLDVYREHAAFPEADLLSQLTQRDPRGWTSAIAFLRDLVAYDSARPFILIAAAAVLAWIPGLRPRAAPRHWLALAAVALLVLALPLRIGTFSFWRTFFEPLPGFSAIRDPRRVIYLFELAVVFAAGFIFSRPGYGRAHRAAVLLVVSLLMITLNQRDVFVYNRPNPVFDRWVASPIAIDDACRSFFVARGSPEYTSRSADMRTLYSLDAAFVALDRSIPTLNGYSAWTPQGWDLFNPEEAVYRARVERWIEAHRLTGVCALDIVSRTMSPVR